MEQVGKLNCLPSPHAAHLGSSASKFAQLLCQVQQGTRSRVFLAQGIGDMVQGTWHLEISHCCGLSRLRTFAQLLVDLLAPSPHVVGVQLVDCALESETNPCGHSGRELMEPSLRQLLQLHCLLGATHFHSNRRVRQRHFHHASRAAGLGIAGLTQNRGQRRAAHGASRRVG
eukprot:364479-Chlamydomonas_euryale.AAC.10